MDEHGIEPKRDAGPRVSRRTFALGAVGACAVIGLGGVKYLPSATLLRPPGGQDEEQLARGCLHCEKRLAATGMGCHECVDVCNYDALELGADNVPVVDVDACNGCGACELACISLSAGSITAGATDRAIVVRPTEEVEA